MRIHFINIFHHHVAANQIRRSHSHQPMTMQEAKKQFNRLMAAHLEAGVANAQRGGHEWDQVQSKVTVTVDARL